MEKHAQLVLSKSYWHNSFPFLSFFLEYTCSVPLGMTKCAISGTHAANMGTYVELESLSLCHTTKNKKNQAKKL